MNSRSIQRDSIFATATLVDLVAKEHQNMPSRARIIAIALLALQAAGDAAADRQDDPSARDLVRLTQWFEGRFDNQEQIWFETEGRAEVAERDRHERVHAIHLRVDLPVFGPQVFYVEEYLDDDSAKVFRQRLVTFESARGEGVRMKLWFFKDAKAVRGAHNNPALLARVTPDDLTHLPECDVYWRADADQYSGSMRPKACVFGNGAERRYSQHDLTLSPSKYWRVDRTFFVDDDRLAVGNPSGVPHQLNRAKAFDCTVNFYGENYLRGPGPDDQRFAGQFLHSQGGSLQLQRRADGKTYLLRLRDKEYPYYTERSDFMFLSIRETGGPFIAYSLHDPDARFIGFNLGWSSVSCERR